MEQCRLIYDLANEGFQFFWWPLAGIFGLLFGYLVFRFLQAVVPQRIQAWQKPLLGLIGFSAAVVFFTMYLPATAFLKHRDLLKSVNVGAVKLVDGPITGFSPFAPNAGRSRESFAVCGVRFAFDPDSIEPGFHRIQSEGSPLQNGIHVRMNYIDDIIVRIEICDGEILPSHCA